MGFFNYEIHYKSGEENVTTEYRCNVKGTRVNKYQFLFHLIDQIDQGQQIPIFVL